MCLRKDSIFKEVGGQYFGQVMAEAIREGSGPGEELLSTCCGDPQIGDYDLCGACHEHASFTCENCPDGADECECK